MGGGETAGYRPWGESFFEIAKKIKMYRNGENRRKSEKKCPKIGTREAGRVPCQLPLHSSMVSFKRKMAKSTFTRTRLGGSKGLDQGRPKVHGDLKTSIRRVLRGAGKKMCSSESSLPVLRVEVS